ncbi:MAG TPA: PspC domain-containing protein [Petrotogaceae bacterium]|jgi:phage shock protein C|nr:PspC domain-containing protein [Petrotogaceae bacterium]
MSKRLYKSRTEKVIDGVCGGIADYFGIDPTLVRLLWIASIFAGGAGIILYIIAMIIIPTEPYQQSQNSQAQSGSSYNYNPQTGEKMYDVSSDGKVMRDNDESVSSMVKVIIGAVFLLMGMYFIANNFFNLSWFFNVSWKVFIGILFIAIGGVIFFRIIKEKK